jgi:hypothetical protein
MLVMQDLFIYVGEEYIHRAQGDVILNVLPFEILHGK